jgi:uncharacterized protein (TIGR02996 family)
MQTLEAGGAQAFLNAIGANPNDEISRFVFADWLQDRDDPRAEKVRELDSGRVLSLFHPSYETNLANCPFYSTNDTGPRAAWLEKEVLLFPAQRPIWRIPGSLHLSAFRVSPRAKSPEPPTVTFSLRHLDGESIGHFVVRRGSYGIFDLKDGRLLPRGVEVWAGCRRAIVCPHIHLTVEER